MEREELVRRLMATFLEELEERVRDFNRDFLALEKDPGPGRAEVLKSALRTAHSLKGAARSVGAGLIESVCHQVEELLGALRDGRLALERDLLQLLFECADAIHAAGPLLREGRSLQEGGLASLTPRLLAAASGAFPAQERQEPASLSQPSGAERGGPDGASVRVAAAKLDALLAQGGQLLVAQRRTEGVARDIEALQEALRRWQAEWRASERVVKRSAQGLPRRAALTLLKTRDRMVSFEKELERLAGRAAADHRALGHEAVRMDAQVRLLRLFPFADACAGLERAVRDLAAAGGKEAQLRIGGGDVELDRSVLEGLKDPLLHLVRNAVAHGLETPAERQAAGKISRGVVLVEAALRGAQVEVAVSDDGRGLDPAAIRKEAKRRGLPEPQDEGELYRLVFLPGFSTISEVTDLSGRGLGLDIVRSRLESLRGAVELASERGRGTRFLLRLPLTLSTASALLVRAGGAVFAIPTAYVQKLVRAGPDAFRSVEGRAVLVAGGSPVPVVPLARILGLEPRGEPRAAKTALLILGSGHRRAALAVDELLSETEVVVKNLGPRLARVRHVSGATLLADGKVALILNASELLETALGRVAAGEPSPAPPAPERRESRARLLVADDSVTTRSLLKSILEAAGFEVAAAADGAQAWDLLQEKGADLVVSDVDMPRMDGVALTEAIRASKRFRELPVVLVTALESERDRARGVEAGADAYLPKSAFDQRNLLETIAQLL